MTGRSMSRAPGRVNLIGDHTDYNQLPVLPMAIRQSVRVDFEAGSDRRILLNSDLTPETPAACAVTPGIPMAPAGDWRNYVYAAVAAVASELEGMGIHPRGIEGSIAGDVPLAAGLSSSSALVVAVGNALLAANGVSLPALTRMKLFARAERYVGTEGGGMDQAASIGGREGHALLIRFDPLQVIPIPVPDDWRFVVIATGTTAEKSGQAQAEYNRRVRLCADALDGVGRHSGRSWSYPELLAELGADGALAAGRSALRAGALSPAAYDCYHHTVSEGGRVERAARAMEAGDGSRFGELMVESHASLRDRYRVSTPALEAATEAASEAGALGARLTGAGFGGSAVALFRAAEAAAAESALSLRVARGGVLAGARVFVARPSQGAEVTLAEPF